jgi:hypothetical protein
MRYENPSPRRGRSGLRRESRQHNRGRSRPSSKRLRSLGQSQGRLDNYVRRP